MYIRLCGILAACGMAAASPAQAGDSICAGLGEWRDQSSAAPHWSVSGQAAGIADISDTGNAVFDAVLQSPLINVPAGGLALHWRQRSRLSWANSAGVLEIRVGAGDWTDFVAAGGQFLSGGYDYRSFAGNPLGARPAWGGEDQSRETRATLPPAAHGQPVQLRFRLGSGGTGDLRPGWRISGLSCQP